MSRPRSAAPNWLALYAAMLLDVAQVFALDHSAGFADPVLGSLAIAAFVTEVSLFSFALRRVDNAVAYGLYGPGTAGVAVISIGWLGEQFTVTKAIALVTVIGGAALLNVAGSKPPHPARPENPPAAADDSPRQWAVYSTGSASLASCRTLVANRSIDTNALTTSALRTSNGIE